jgi:hypothetical protein
MALLGVGLSGLLAAVAGSVLLARLLERTAHPTAAAIVGAVLLVADVVSGRTTFALGAVAALAALVALPHRGRAAVLAVLTGLVSPVAAAFLGFAATLLVLHRRPGGWTLGLAASVPVVLLAVLFPGGGIQPFDAQAALPAVLVGLGLAALTTEPVVRTGALLWTLAVLVLVNHDDPFGSNVLRLGIVLAASLVLATSRVRGPVLVAAVVACLAWQLDPTHGDLQALGGPRTAGLTAELLRLQSHRAEVAAPLNHHEAWQVAERIPLARGWSRQIDLKQNPLFYRQKLSAAAFTAWLRDNAVDTVAVPRRGQIDFGSTTEVALMRHPVAGLEQVWQDADWSVYRVLDQRPIARAPAVVIQSTRTELRLRSEEAATVDVEVRWSRWLTLEGDGCLERRGNRVRIRFLRPGPVTLTSSLRPSGRC